MDYENVFHIERRWPMDRHESTFEQMILADRSGREIKGWKGRFVDYLELVKTDPGLAKLSHARICDVILKSGTTAIGDSGDSNTKRIFKDESLKVYEFFCGRIFRDRKNHRQNSAIFPRRISEGRRKPAGALSDGAGRVREELARREAASVAWRTAIRFMPSKTAQCSRNRFI